MTKVPELEDILDQMEDENHETGGVGFLVGETIVRVVAFDGFKYVDSNDYWTINEELVDTIISVTFYTSSGKIFQWSPFHHLHEVMSLYQSDEMTRMINNKITRVRSTNLSSEWEYTLIEHTDGKNQPMETLLRWRIRQGASPTFAEVQRRSEPFTNVLGT